MKRKLFILLIFFFIGFLLSSCEEDCANCGEVTYDADGNIVSEETAYEYCDAELDEIEAEDPIVIGEGTPAELITQWECE